MKLFLVSGERSGDRHGAGLMEELRARQAREFGRQPRLLPIQLRQLSLLATSKQSRVGASNRFKRGGAGADFAAQHSFDC